MMQDVYWIFLVAIMSMNICLIQTANLAIAVMDPFALDETSVQSDVETNEAHTDTAGPSLDLIDSHSHDDHDDNNSSVIESAKRSLIQPSFDFLDAQLHGGDDHVHHETNETSRDAADLNDFQRWLEEQNQTDQLSRFISLQKEVNQLRLKESNDLNEKLNRTIEQLKSSYQQYKREL